MGILDTIKNLFAPKAKEVADKLGIDDSIIEKLEGLLVNLDASADTINLDDAAKTAKSSLQEGIAGFKNGGLDLSAVIEKAKSLFGCLENIQLPEELSGIVNTLKGLLNK